MIPQYKVSESDRQRLGNDLKQNKKRLAYRMAAALFVLVNL